MARFNLAETTEDELLNYFRVSTRVDRAVDLVDFVVEEAQGLFLVRSQSKPGTEYTVDLQAKSCDCPDWTFRGSVNGIPCKHIMAAYLAAHRKPEGDRE
jgi:predicted nucleic acid-binding Zn finger protein